MAISIVSVLSIAGYNWQGFIQRGGKTEIPPSPIPQGFEGEKLETHIISYLKSHEK